MVDSRLSADELPDVAIEAAKFFLYFKKRLGIRDRGCNFQLGANDSRVSHQRPNFLAVITRNFRRIEAVKCAAVVLALIENRLPAQARLRAFQDRKLEKHPGVMAHDTPRFIVVIDLYSY